MMEDMKMNVEELRAEIRRLDQVIDDAREKKRAYENELAQLTAKFKVGDRVRAWNFNKCVMEITGIRWGYNSPQYVAARVLKNGSLGSTNYDLYGEIIKVEV